MPRLVSSCVAVLLVGVANGYAAPQTIATAGACDAAVAAAERRIALPPRLLGAIAAVESGRLQDGVVRPWPWTINALGTGQFFATKAQAIAAVRTLQAQGIRSIDVGCLQVNLAYHRDAFVSLEAAFDPATNAAYAARFLNALHTDTRDWTQAIGAYHSQTPLRGAAYRAAVLARWERPELVPTALGHAVYRDFADPQVAYAAFRTITPVYGAFAKPR